MTLLGLLRSVASLSLLLMVLHPASAQAAGSTSITLDLQGTNAARCGLSNNGNFPSANLNASGSAGASISVDCNAPFWIRARSANGGFKSVNSTTNASYSGLQPYTLSLAIPLDMAGPAATSCASASLTAAPNGCALSGGVGTGLSSGTGIAIGATGTLTIAWTAPGSGAPRLLAGNYSDTITITIEARP